MQKFLFLGFLIAFVIIVIILRLRGRLHNLVQGFKAKNREFRHSRTPEEQPWVMAFGRANPRILSSIPESVHTTEVNSSWLRCQVCGSRYDVNTYSLPTECKCLGMVLRLPRLWYCYTGCKEIHVIRHVNGKSELIPLKELDMFFVGRPGQEPAEVLAEKFRRVLDLQEENR